VIPIMLLIGNGLANGYQMSIVNRASISLSHGASWGYSILSISVVSMVSLSLAMLILLIPPKGKLMNVIMSIILSLGVGVLVGDAIIHLMPSFFACQHWRAESARAGSCNFVAELYHLLWNLYLLPN
jgi:hypothetical protein